MASNALATMGDLDWSVIDDVVAKGDLSKLTTEQRTKYYRMFCESLKLNPVTQPFQYMSLNGKLVLYATKGAADQLRNINHISIEIVAAETRGDDFCVTVRATTPNGRFDEDFASVTIAGLRGDPYHNAKLKAITKAKRRVTLSICGLGINDETEVITIPNARLLTPEELGAEVDEDGAPVIEPAPIREIRAASVPIERPVQATVTNTPRKMAQKEGGGLTNRQKALWATARKFYADDEQAIASEKLHAWCAMDYPDATNEGKPSIRALSDEQCDAMIGEMELAMRETEPIEGEASEQSAQ